MNVIEAHGLGKRYGRTWALRDLSIAIPEGRVTALVGPNGAGKTTLLHVAVDLTAPTTGKIAVLGNRRPATHRRWPTSLSWPRTLRLPESQHRPRDHSRP